MSGIVVVGAGHAAGQLVGALRQGGYAGPIAMVGDEPVPPYQRPPLSKQYLSGDWTQEKLYLRPATFYAQKEVDLRLNETVSQVDLAAKQAVLAGGGSLPFEHVVFATGSRVRKLTLPGDDLGNVFYLRTLDDVDHIRAALAPGKRIVIVGGGYIGLEVAAVSRKAGLAVTVLEMESRILQRVATEDMSTFYTQMHTRAGVEIRVNMRVSALQGNGTVSGVSCQDGTRFDADLVLIGVGVIPNTELAAHAGIAVDNGILVNDHCQTNHAAAYAIGDCARGQNNCLGRMVRLESVPNAMEQARVTANNLCGKPTAYATLPWFWSDQYDLKLQMAGFASDGDQAVVRGDPTNYEKPSFITFYLKQGRLVAVEAVNQPRDFLMARQLCERKVQATPAQLTDPDFNLKSLAG